MLFKKKLLSIVIAVGAILTLLFLLRSCFRETPQHKNVYVIGRDSTWHMLSTFGKEKKLVAFTNDLMNLISEKTNLRFQWFESGPTALMDDLYNGICDAILEGIVPSPLNKDRLVFSGLLLETGPVLVVEVDSKYQSLAEMDGKTIGLNWSAPFSYNPQLQSVINTFHLVSVNYSNPYQAFDALIKDQIDGVIVESIRAYSLAEGLYKGKIKIVTHPLTDDGLNLIALNDPTGQLFMEEVSKVVKELKANGEYQMLLTKWGLINPENLSLFKKE